MRTRTEIAIYTIAVLIVLIIYDYYHETGHDDICKKYNYTSYGIQILPYPISYCKVVCDKNIMNWVTENNNWDLGLNDNVVRECP